MYLAFREYKVPSKRIEDMRDDIVVQRHGRLIAIDSPVRVVHAVPVHNLQWCGKSGVVTR